MKNSSARHGSGTVQRSETDIVLASASPRRAELLALAGIDFSVVRTDIPEEPLPGEPPAEYALRLSQEKAKAGASASGTGRFFVGADTIVVLAGLIMGKPVDREDAIAMLQSLSGRTHEVITAYTVLDTYTSVTISRAVSTEVLFAPLDQSEIERYVDTGCPMDKAGGYAIQGGAAHMVREIRGSYTNVVGLPTSELIETLRQIGALTDR